MKHLSVYSATIMFQLTMQQKKSHINQHVKKGELLKRKLANGKIGYFTSKESLETGNIY